ncbi:MAG: OB-fold nucleic acid binding domain-containing protein, partial [Candidatus Hadarchaeales archaeon]
QNFGGKMDEHLMKRLSLLCSVAGIAIVYAAGVTTRPRLTPISAIDNTFLGTEVTVSGCVVDLRESRDGHLFLKIQDSSGDIITTPIFSKTRSDLGETIDLLDILEVRGKVTIYNGELEILPSGARSIKVVHTAPASPSQLGVENVGKPAKVHGTISRKDVVGSGNLLLTLQENGAKLPLYIPRSIAQNGIPEIHTGDHIIASGWLQLYENDLELKITSSSGIRLLEAA